MMLLYEKRLNLGLHFQFMSNIECGFSKEVDKIVPVNIHCSNTSQHWNVRARQSEITTVAK